MKNIDREIEELEQQIRIATTIMITQSCDGILCYKCPFNTSHVSCHNDLLADEVLLRQRRAVLSSLEHKKSELEGQKKENPAITLIIDRLKNAYASGVEISTKDGELCYPMLSGCLKVSIESAIADLERINA